MSQDEETKKYLFSMLQNQSQFSLPQGFIIYTHFPFAFFINADMWFPNFLMRTPYRIRVIVGSSSNKYGTGNVIWGNTVLEV